MDDEMLRGINGSCISDKNLHAETENKKIFIRFNLCYDETLFITLTASIGNRGSLKIVGKYYFYIIHFKAMKFIEKS